MNRSFMFVGSNHYAAYSKDGILAVLRGKFLVETVDKISFYMDNMGLGDIFSIGEYTVVRISGCVGHWD